MHVTIVTGASRGLGLAVTDALLQRGHHVLALARGATELASAADATGRLESWRVDLADAEPVAERLQAWIGALAAPKVESLTLINNAGVVSQPAMLSALPLATLRHDLRVGLESALLLTGAFLAASRGWTAPRKVLLVSSGLGRRAMAGGAVYCAAKAGMDHLARALALEEGLLPSGARVVSLAPGIIDTGMQVTLRGADRALFPEAERFAQFKATGQLDSPETAAAKLLRYLDRADFGSNPVADVRDA